MSAEGSTTNNQPDDAEAAGKTAPKIEIRFDAKKMTLLLGLAEQSVNPGLAGKLAEHGFTPKDELHMTVLGFKAGGKLAKALKAMPEAERQTAVAAIGTAAQNTEWSVTPNGEFFGLERQYEGEGAPRRSLVEMVDCPQLEGFYDAIGSMFPDVELEVPPAHVTLGTQGNPQGIGINTVAELQRFGHQVELG